MKFKLALIALVAAMTVGCSTTTIKRKGTAKLATDPTFQESQPFYFWGLAGSAAVDVKEICGKRPALQLQSQETFVDSLLTIVTLGIYSPRTAKVWCYSKSKKRSKKRRRS